MEDDVSYTATIVDDWTLIITATAGPNDLWSYDESLVSVYTVSISGDDGSTSHVAGAFSYTFNASGTTDGLGQVETTAYTFVVSANRTASQSWTEDYLSTGWTGTTTYAWNWSQQFSDSVSNDTNFAVGTGTGTSSGTGSIHWFDSATGSYLYESDTGILECFGNASSVATVSFSQNTMAAYYGSGWSHGGSATVVGAGEMIIDYSGNGMFFAEDDGRTDTFQLTVMGVSGSEYDLLLDFEFSAGGWRPTEGGATVVNSHWQTYDQAETTETMASSSWGDQDNGGQSSGASSLTRTYYRDVDYEETESYEWSESAGSGDGDLLPDSPAASEPMLSEISSSKSQDSDSLVAPSSGANCTTGSRGWWGTFKEWLWSTFTSAGAPPFVGALEGAPGVAEAMLIQALQRRAARMEAAHGPNSPEAKYAYREYEALKEGGAKTLREFQRNNPPPPQYKPAYQ